MVQMKHAVKACLDIYSINLYIPHGSDETFNNWCIWAINKFLYIPHGSDETLSKCR